MNECNFHTSITSWFPVVLSYCVHFPTRTQKICAFITFITSSSSIFSLIHHSPCHRRQIANLYQHDADHCRDHTSAKYIVRGRRRRRRLSVWNPSLISIGATLMQKVKFFYRIQAREKDQTNKKNQKRKKHPKSILFTKHDNESLKHNTATQQKRAPREALIISHHQRK